MPKFTIATVSYNSERWIKQTIDSVLSSTHDDFELIISDDCSTDNSWNIIQQYTDPRIRFWRNKFNIGEYPNRNKILREAQGQFIIYIDGDDILYKDTLDRFDNYLQAFPSTKAIWGVYPLYFDFVVFPYIFNPSQFTSLNYLSTYPVSIVGFAESLFSVKALLEIGGFDERFAIGDTYIKRKFSLYYSVVLVTAGFTFWRQYPGQASDRIRNFYKHLIELYQIDKEILWQHNLPLTDSEINTARKNFEIRSIKLIVLNTLLKGRILDFFKLINELKVPYSKLHYLLKKGDYSYKGGTKIGEPLMNEYHFTN